MQKEQKCYTITDNLAEDIIQFYKEAFPLSTKIPTSRQVKRQLKMMYKPKVNNRTYIIKNELYTDRNDIFKLIEADYA